MTIEMDRKEGTEPESSKKKKKTVTIDRKVLLGWWVFLVSVAGWMFYLGIIVGRESAPVYFDATQLDSDLMAMVSSVANPENTDVVLPETTESNDLDFYEALKDNKGGNKKIAELEALQSKSKLAAMQPERLPAKATDKDSNKDEEALSLADASDNGHDSKSKTDLSVKQTDKSSASVKGAKAAQGKTDKKTDEKKSLDKKADDKKADDKKAGDKKIDLKKSEKEKTADSVKKESKTVAEPVKMNQQKQETKTVSVTDKTKDLQKQTVIKNSVPEISTKKIEKTADTLTSKNSEQIKKQSSAKDQPHKPIEALTIEKIKDVSVAKTGDVKAESNLTEHLGVKKEQPKSGKYTIQAGAYTTHNDALESAKKLTTAGYSSYVVKGKGSDGKEWYRIRVGNYGDREKAVKMAETIKGAGFPAMVINAPQE